MSAIPKIWFITGSSSGFGREMVQVALDKGDIVIATLLEPELLADLVQKWAEDRLHVLKLDVTQPDEIVHAFAYAKEKLGRIDIVHNNAGVGLISEVEPIIGTEMAARKLFEVNYWGALHIMQEAVKFMRDVNPAGAGGRILNCSSAAGIVSPARSGYYSASKHALEAISEAMAAELLPAWDIKITILEPGMFVTPMNSSAVPVLGPHPAYIDAAGKSITPSIIEAYPITGSAIKAAEVFWRLSRLDNPPLRLALGKDCVKNVTAWCEAFIKGAEDFSSWSDDVAVEFP